MTLTIQLFGNVKLITNNKAIETEPFQIKIEAQGTNIEFPNITEIGGYKIKGESTSISTRIFNGYKEETQAKTYTIYPTKDFIIEPIKIIIDNKIELTKKKAIKVRQIPISKLTDDIYIEQKLSKTDIYVGELIKNHIMIKIKNNYNYNKIRLIQPETDFLQNNGIINDSGTYEKNGYTYKEFDIYLKPRIDGDFEIPSYVLKVGKIIGYDNFFGKQIKYTKIYSNKQKISIKPLPNNLTIYGENLIISVNVNKKTQNINQPINLIIKIVGKGNLDEIEKYKLNIPNVDEYSEEPIMKGNVFYQKISLIAEKDFEIPSLTLKYFDIKSKKEKVIKTNPIKIHINGTNKLNKIKTESIKKKEQTKQLKEEKEKIKLTKKEKIMLIILTIILLIMIIKRKEIKDLIKNEYKYDYLKKLNEKDLDKELTKIKFLLNDKNLNELINLYKKNKSKEKKKNIIDKLNQL